MKVASRYLIWAAFVNDSGLVSQDAVEIRCAVKGPGCLDSSRASIPCIPVAKSRPVFSDRNQDEDALWEYGNPAASAQTWAATIAREISKGLVGARLADFQMQHDVDRASIDPAPSSWTASGAYGW